jgi:hypothetical protein
VIKIPKDPLNNIGVQHIIEAWREEESKEILPLNSIEDSVGNEENEYPVSDPNRMMLIMSNKPSYVH